MITLTFMVISEQKSDKYKLTFCEVSHTISPHYLKMMNISTYAFDKGHRLKNLLDGRFRVYNSLLLANKPKDVCIVSNCGAVKRHQEVLKLSSPVQFSKSRLNELPDLNAKVSLIDLDFTFGGIYFSYQ